RAGTSKPSKKGEARRGQTQGVGRQRQAIHRDQEQKPLSGREAGPPRRRQPPDREGRRDASVQAYIAAMSGWKRDVGRRLDALIVRTVPAVRKAVKWNSPFRYLDFHEDDQLDEELMASWIRQASELPGWVP